MVSRVASDCGVVVGSATRTAIPEASSTRAGDTSAIPGSAASAAVSGCRTPGSSARSTAMTSGAVGAGAEALGDQVVGASLGARLRHGALVGEAEGQRRDRRGEGEQQQRRPDGVRRGVPADVRGPAVPATVGSARGASRPSAVDAVSGEAEQGRQQGDRGEHHHQHDDRDADPAGGDERDPGDDQAEDGDDHDAAGEDDRPAGGGQRATDRVLDGVALGELLAVAGDDEQGVVDPDAEADHRPDHAAPSSGMSTAYATRGSRPRATARPDQRGPDRQPHRDQGAERHQQHDDRDERGRSPRWRRRAPSRRRSTGRRRPRSAAGSTSRRSSRADLRLVRSCGSRCWVSGYCTRTSATSPSVVTVVPRTWGSAASVSSTGPRRPAARGCRAHRSRLSPGSRRRPRRSPSRRRLPAPGATAASWESRPGASNGSSRSCPKAVDAARTSMATTTQAPITIQGRRAAKRPRRARVSDMDPPSRPDAGGHIGREAGAGSAATAEEGSAFRPVSAGVSFPTLKR